MLKNYNFGWILKTLFFMAFIGLYGFIGVSNANASVYCVRSGASGNGSGSDWYNAYPNLPANLVRGATYYVADGTYGTYAFDDAESGIEVITIKKAVVADHGTNVGWAPSYGDGQAVFTADTEPQFGIVRFETGYYEFNGAKGGGPSTWKSGHGILIDCESKIAYGIMMGADVTDISIKHIEIAGDRECDKDQRGIQQAHGGSDIYIGYCYIHDTYKDFIEIYHVDDAIIEYNFLGPNQNSDTDIAGADVHGAGIVLRDNNTVDIRHNFIEDVSETAYICLVNDDVGEELTNVSIYGNIFYETRETDGVRPPTTMHFGRANTTVTNFHFYNNTIANRYVAGGGTAGISSFMINGGGNEIKNNIWYNNHTNVLGIPTGWAHSYNYYIDNKWTAPAEDSRQVSTGTIFKNMLNRDFRLLSQTAKGTTLPSPYNIDTFGHTRASDGVWDRGAIEFDSGITPPKSPSGVHVQ